MLRPKPVYLYLLLLIAALFAAALSSAAVEPELGPPPTLPDVAAVETAVNGDNLLYLPLINIPPEPPPWVDTQSRAAVQQFYLTEYLASEGL